MRDKNILRVLFVFGLVAYPIVFWRKRPIKDWFLVYLLVAFITAIIDKIVVGKGWVSYPKTLFNKYFMIHCTFDFVLCPLMNVVFNQVTIKDKPIKWFYKVFYFLVPMTIFEAIIEKNTDLLSYKKGWKPYHTFITLTIKYLSIRFIIEGTRLLSQKQIKNIEKQKSPEHDKGTEEYSS